MFESFNVAVIWWLTSTCRFHTADKNQDLNNIKFTYASNCQKHIKWTNTTKINYAIQLHTKHVS